MIKPFKRQPMFSGLWSFLQPVQKGIAFVMPQVHHSHLHAATVHISAACIQADLPLAEQPPRGLVLRKKLASAILWSLVHPRSQTQVPSRARGFRDRGNSSWLVSKSYIKNMYLYYLLPYLYGLVATHKHYDYG